MSDVEYSVAAILQLTGDADAERKLARVAKAADKTNDRLKLIGSGAAQGLGSVGSWVGDTIDQLGKLTIAGAVAGTVFAGAVGFSAVKTGLVDVNAKLEDATLGFGTLFRMFGETDTVDQGFGLAKDLIGQIREDAKQLPGEFGDFVGMAQTITAPLLNAGKHTKEIRDLTRDTVVAASALGIRYDQASREMAMLLEGHAGGHNILGTRLGITTSTQVKGKDFNLATNAERFDYITKKLGPAKESLNAYAMSWSGLTSTLTDAGKQFLGNATGPLFGRLKMGMIDLVHYTNTHEAQIHHLEEQIGVGLHNAYVGIESRIRRLPDAIDAFRARWTEIHGQAEGLAHTISGGIHSAVTMLTPAAKLLGNELEHPARLLKEIVALRIAAGLASGAPGMLNFGLNAAKAFGPGAAGAGAAEAGAGAAAGAGGAALAAGAGVALLGIAAVGTAIFDDTLGSATTAKLAVADLSTTFDGLFDSVTSREGLVRQGLGLTGAAVIELLDGALYPWREGVKLASGELIWMNNNLEQFVKLGFGLDEVRVKVDAWKVGIETVTEAAITSIPVIGSLASSIRFLRAMAEGTKFEGVPDEPIDHTTDAPATQKILGAHGENPFAAPEKAKVTPPPVFNGAKFEIKIDARDQDPDRIIRRLVTEIGEKARGARAMVPGGM